MTQYYVDPNGADSNPGSIDLPFKTIARAQVALRASPDRGTSPLTVFLRGGTHCLSEPLVVTSADSGTAEAPVLYAAYDGDLHSLELAVPGNADVAWAVTYEAVTGD